MIHDMMVYTCLAAGAYNIAFGLIIQSTGNRHILSSCIFKVLPFFLGCGTSFVGCKLLGWL